MPSASSILFVVGANAVCVQISQPGYETSTLNTVSTCFLGHLQLVKISNFAKKNPEGLLDESDFFLQISSLATLHKSKWGCHFVQQLVLFTQPFQNISADRKAYSAALLRD